MQSHSECETELERKRTQAYAFAMLIFVGSIVAFFAFMGAAGWNRQHQQATRLASYTPLQLGRLQVMRSELKRALLPPGSLLLTHDGRLQKIWGPATDWDGKDLWKFSYERRGALTGIEQLDDIVLERSVRIIRPTDADYPARAAEYLQQSF